MVHVRFDPNSVNWKAFFASQSIQYGGAYYVGVPYQRGYGIGSVFKSLYRFLLPITEQIGKEIGKEGFATSVRFLNDIIQGQSPKEALVTESKEGLKNLLKKGSDKLQEGGGRKRRTQKSTYKRKKPIAVSLDKKRVVGRSVRRSALSDRKADYLDL